MAPLLSQPVKALMPLHRVGDPATALAFPLAPSLSVPLFPSSAVKAYTLAPSLSRRFRRRRCPRPDLNGKSRRRLYLHLGMGRLYVNDASKQERSERAECGFHEDSFELFTPFSEQWIEFVRSILLG
jgi:hypothetical protein